MTPEVETAVRASAEKASIIDTELIRVDAFSALLEQATVETADRVVLKMLKLKPHFFVPFEKLQDNAFKAREQAIREDSRKAAETTHETMGHFKDLDAARLDAKELRALENSLARNYVTPEEKGLLTSALARQISERNIIKENR